MLLVVSASLSSARFTVICQISLNKNCSWRQILQVINHWLKATHLKLSGCLIIKSLLCSGSEEFLLINRFSLNPASKKQSKSFSGGWSHPPWLLLTRKTSPVDSCEKQRVTVCQNHNKPLLRQSLTGFPSGSCVTSWDNETAAPQPTTCCLSVSPDSSHHLYSATDN